MLYRRGAGRGSKRNVSDGDVVVLEEELGFLAYSIDRPISNRKVHTVCAEIGKIFGGLDVDRNVGHLSIKPGEPRDEPPLSKSPCGRNRHDAAGSLLVEIGESVCQGVKPSANAGKEAFARGRQNNCAACAFE